MSNRQPWCGVATLVGVLTLSACSHPLSNREKGALIGGGAGAAIGGALGGITGGLVGDQLQQRDQLMTEQQQEIERQRQELAHNRELLEQLRNQNLEARETERGVVVNLPDVLFEFGRAELTPEARVKVRDIAEVLNNTAKDRQIAVEGHTDSVGGASFNQRLSEDRAENVTFALESSGVSPRRIATRGYGERYPIAPNAYSDGVDNPAGRAKNRRVEVIIQN